MSHALVAVDEIVEEWGRHNYSQDSLGIMFNNIGLLKFAEKLNNQHEGGVPLFVLPLQQQNIASVLLNIEKLFPYTKGIALRLVAPQSKRKLVGYLHERILTYVNRREIESSINILHELTANAEKANIEFVIKKHNLVTDKKEIPQLVRKERYMLLDVCHKEDKWVKIGWKFTHSIFKLEVKNNVPIPEEGVFGIKQKIGTKLDTLADGFIGEREDQIGAGLGLYFVNFFREEMKNQYDFESIFRIYENDFGETIASLTVLFEKE